MKTRLIKPMLAIRSFGTILLLLLTLILPMIGSAKGLGRMVCVRPMQESVHDCVHCNSSLGEPVVQTVEPEIEPVVESCCHPDEPKSTASVGDPEESLAKIAPVESDCKCEMAPANSQPDTNGQLSPGFAWDPIAPLEDFQTQEPVFSETSVRIDARSTRGPPDPGTRLGPPDRAPPVV